MTAGAQSGRALCALMLAASVTAGCAPVARDPYASDLEAAAQSATSALEQEILADRHISRTEYDEAVDTYVRCMESRGYEVLTIDHGGAYTFTLDHPGYDVDVDNVACSTGTTAVVGVLYVQQFLNPAKEDLDDVVARCLVRHGLVDSDYDGRHLETESAPGGIPSYDLDDAATAACFMNPQA